jgi:hypothetical protein
MRVFICWSKSRSRQLADKLSKWLPRVLGEDRTVFNLSTGFEVGKEWFPQLIKGLTVADAAIICLTPENLDSRWMHFEAGMIFRSGKAKALPIYLGAQVEHIKEPLNAIQASPCTKEGSWRMVEALASRGRLDRRAIASRFDREWSDFEKFLHNIEAPQLAEVLSDHEGLFHRKTFDEPVEECTSQGWLDRYLGARQTLEALQRQRDVVEACCVPWQRWLYGKLINHVDEYARLMRETLLVQRRFEVTESRRVDFARPLEVRFDPAGAIAAVCAYRCREIRHVEFCLNHREGAPVLAESLEFAKMSLDQRDDKKLLIESKGTPVDRTRLGLGSDDLDQCARSAWKFDRIIRYKIAESNPTDADTMMGLVEYELQQTDAIGNDASKMPLYYSVKAWLANLKRAQRAPLDIGKASSLAADVQSFLDRSTRPRDSGANDPKIRANLESIRKLVESRAPYKPRRKELRAAQRAQGVKRTRAGPRRKRAES